MARSTSASYTRLNTAEDSSSVGLVTTADNLHIVSSSHYHSNSGRKKVVILLCVIALLLLMITLFMWKLPHLRGEIMLEDKVVEVSYTTSPNYHTMKNIQPIFWQHTIQHIGSESVVRLMDVNGDGAADLLFGLAQITNSNNTDFISQSPSYCHAYEHGCLGAVVAWDGKTGDILWKISTYNEIFELNCGNIDINRDGRMDCLGAGRKGAFISFDYKTGNLLWNPQTGKEAHLNFEWNIYNPLVLDDATDDGIPEILIAHGGDPRYGSEITDRNASRLILLDGASGEQVGVYITTPDMRELYSSPVLHRSSGLVYFGTGGETVPGSLWAIETSKLLQKFYSAYNATHGVTEQLLNLKTVNHFYQVLEAKEKGVMVPVVMVDVNLDSTLDVIVMSFDGVLAAYDGRTVTELWRNYKHGTESYATPGVGYFDDDEIPDLMIHWNYGEWPKYNQSLVAVHSGRDGSVIWSEMHNNTFSMTSPLVVRTDRANRDVFVYRLRTIADDSVGQLHGVDPQRMVGGVDNPHHKSSVSVSNLYAVNWENRARPFLISSEVSKRYCYNYTDSANMSRQRCTDMELQSRTTGALGDLTGNGSIGLAITYNAEAMLFDKDNFYTGSEVSLTVTSINLESLLAKHLSNHSATNCLPMAEQIWTEYMGRNSLSSYILPENR